MVFRVTFIDEPATADVAIGTRSEEIFMQILTLISLVAAVLLTSREHRRRNRSSTPEPYSAPMTSPAEQWC